VASEDEGVFVTSFWILNGPGGCTAGNRGSWPCPSPRTATCSSTSRARYYSEDNKEFGLQYLFGIVDTADTDAAQAPVHQDLAFDRRTRSGPSRS